MADEVSRIVGMNRGTLYEWVRHYKEDGVEGLAPQEGRPGRFATGRHRTLFHWYHRAPGTHLLGVRPFWSGAVQGRQRRRAKRACPGKRRPRVRPSPHRRTTSRGGG